MIGSNVNKYAICTALAISALSVGIFTLFSSHFENQFSVPSLNITKYTDRFNVVRVRDPSVIVPVTIGTVRYDIPAPYIYVVGVWDATSGSYSSPLGMYVKGTDFSPKIDEKVNSKNKPLNFWIVLNTKNYLQTAALERGEQLLWWPV
jgi:hypothetical protein